MARTQIKVTFRDIAKLFVKAMPLEGQEFGNKVNEYTDIIKAMPTEAKVALKSAYIFSSKVPKVEREDMFQELALAIYKAQTKDEKLAYAIARCDWRDWWAKYKVRQHYYAGSLNSTVLDSEGNECEICELLIGETEFEFKMDGKIDAERIWDKLPDKIKPIVQKRLLGYPLLKPEHNTLSYYVKTQGYKLLLA